MKSDIYWIKGEFPGRIALVPRPRGGDWLEDEVSSWKEDGVDVVVSMLEPCERDELDLSRESEVCRINGIDFLSVPVPDQGVPAIEEIVERCVLRCAEELSSGRTVAVHCRQSLGRAPMFTALLMTTFGISPDEAFDSIGTARGVAVPETEEQRVWVEEFSDEMIASRLEK